MIRTSLAFAALLLTLAARGLPAQQPSPLCDIRTDGVCARIDSLGRRTDVRRAFSFIELQNTIARTELIALTQIAAPPFNEQRRAAEYARLLRAAGADSVHIDSVGNVIALRRGTSRSRVVAFAGHLDTVFPDSTDVRVRQRGDTLFAPGIGDDTRGLIAILHLLRALVHANIRTQADLLFIGTVGEEGLGDLRGAKYLFRSGAPRIDAFIAIDTDADDDVVTQAVGSRRFRVSFRGPGGHSWIDFGTANPAFALSRGLAAFDQDAAPFTATAGPRTTYSVGRIGGGSSINAIPAEAWAEIDMRSESAQRLAALDSIFQRSMRTALERQNAAAARGAQLQLILTPVGDRPPGVTPAESSLVQHALAASRWIGGTPRITASSTDANAAIARGVPAITIGRGGINDHAHSLTEYWLDDRSWRAVQRALLIAVAEAGLR